MKTADRRHGTQNRKVYKLGSQKRQRSFRCTYNNNRIKYYVMFKFYPKLKFHFES